MKKILAVLFTVSLLMGTLFPVCVSAEDPAGTLVYEFDNLAESSQVGTEHILRENGEILVEYANEKDLWGKGGLKADDPETPLVVNFTIDLTAAQAGSYVPQFAFWEAPASWISTMTLLVNGTAVGNNSTSRKVADLSVRNESGGLIYPWAFNGMFLYEGTPVILNEGANTVAVSVAAADDGYYKFIADYVKFIPGTEGTVDEVDVVNGTTFEAENMATQNIQENIQGGSGGKWVGHFGFAFADEFKPIETRVKFTESRFYDLTYVANGWNTWVSEVAFYLDDLKIGSNKDDDALKVDVRDRFTSSGNGDPVDFVISQGGGIYEYNKKKVWIDAGTYTLAIKAEPAEQAEQNKIRVFEVDFINFKGSADSVKVEKTGTSVEMEDMATQNILAVTGASGGGWIGSPNFPIANEFEPIETAVTFTESGYYDVSLVASRWDPWLSEVAVSLDDNKIISSKDEIDSGVNVQNRFTPTDPENGEDPVVFSNALCQIHEYTKTQVYIEAGKYMLNVAVNPGEADENADKRIYYADCVTFKETTDYITVDEAGTTVEAEEMTEQNILDVIGASGGGWIGSPNFPHVEFDPIQTLVYFPEDGTYDLSYVASKWHEWVSEFVILLDGKKISSSKDEIATAVDVRDRFTQKAENDNDPVYFSNQNCAMHEYTKKDVSVDAGIHSLEVQVLNAEEQATRIYYLDSITFKGNVDSVAIDPAGTTLEAEDMATQYILEGVKGASGRGWIGSPNVPFATDFKPVKTYVNFTESGYYDMSFVSSNWNEWISEVAIYLGDEKLGSNKDDDAIKVNVQDRFTPSSDAWDDPVNWTAAQSPMHEYAKTKLWIEAGVYPLEIRIEPAENEAQNKIRVYDVDCVTFKATADTVAKNDINVYTAFVNFAQPVSGIAVIAVYNGNQLLGTNSQTVTNVQTLVTVGVQTDEPVTHVKVFVWDGFVNCIPQIGCKNLPYVE